MPVTLPAIHVNDRWPKGVPFIFVPPQLLSALPPIPGELQYRIVGHALVLWDHHADLIVDVLPDAFAKVKSAGAGGRYSDFRNATRSDFCAGVSPRPNSRS